MDSVQVAIRIRPLNERELLASEGTSWQVEQDTIAQCTVEGRLVPGGSFAFDHVFNSGTDTEHIYNQVAQPIVQAAMEGINGTIFAYGQTSSGKTHTMLGSGDCPGIIPMAVDNIFEEIENHETHQFLLRVSYAEIYNEVVSDLLEPSLNNLKIHEHPNGEVYVANLSETVVQFPHEVMALLYKGNEQRHVASTRMNDRSSRSHTVFRIVVESRDSSDDPAGEDEVGGYDPVKVGHLNLVDLAGSERVSNTGAEGQRLKEGASINKSLLSLGQVISKLSEGVTPSTGHIPYRDSKLTRLLQNSLGGNARTAVVAAITPSGLHVEETLSTLKFASRAKSVTNNAVVNEVFDGDVQLLQLRRRIQDLEHQKQALESGDVVRKLEEENEAMATLLKQKEEAVASFRNMVLHANGLVALGSPRVTSKRSQRNRRKTWAPGVAGKNAARRSMAGPMGAVRRPGRPSLLPAEQVFGSAMPAPMEMQLDGADNVLGSHVDTTRRRGKTQAAGLDLGPGFSEIDQLRAKNAKLAAAKAELTRCLEDANTMLAETVEAKELLELQLANGEGSSSDDVALLQAELEAKQDEYETLEQHHQRELVELEEVTLFMRTELEVYASRTPQASPSAAIKQATRAMHADLDATKAQVAELTAQLAVRDGMVSELQGQLEALKKTQAASSTEQDTVKSNLSQLKDNLEVAEQAVVAAAEEMAVLRAEAHQQATSELQAQLDTMQAAVTEADRQRQLAVDEAFEHEHKHTSLQAKHDALTAELQGLRGEAPMPRDTSDLEAQLAQTQAALSELQASTQAQADEVSAELSQAQIGLALAQETAATATAQVSQATATCATFGIPSLEAIPDFLLAIKAKVEELQATADTACEARTALEVELSSKLDAATTALAALAEQANSTAAVDQQAQDTLLQAQEAQTQLTSQLTALTGELEAAKAAKDDAMSAQATAAEQLAVLQAEIVLVEAVKAEAVSAQSELHQQLEALMEAHEAVETGQAQQDTGMAELLTEQKRLLDECTQLENEAAEWEYKTVALEMHLQSAEAQLHASEQERMKEQQHAQQMIHLLDMHPALTAALTHIEVLEAEQDALVHALDRAVDTDEALELACQAAEQAYQTAIANACEAANHELLNTSAQLAVADSEEDVQRLQSRVMELETKLAELEAAKATVAITDMDDDEEEHLADAEDRDCNPSDPASPAPVSARKKKRFLQKALGSLLRSKSKSRKKKSLAARKDITSPFTQADATAQRVFHLVTPQAGGSRAAQATSAVDMPAGALVQERADRLQARLLQVEMERETLIEAQQSAATAREHMEEQLIASAGMTERLKAEVTGLKSHLEEAVAARTELEQAQAQGMVQQLELAAQIEEMEALDSQLKTQQVTIAELEAQLEANVTASLQAETSVETGQLLTLTSELEQALASVVCLKNELAALKQDRDVHEGRGAVLTQQLADAAKHVTELEEHVTTLDSFREQVVVLQADITAANTAQSSLQDRLQQAEAAVAETVRSQSESTEHEAAMVAVTEQLGLAEVQVADLTTQVASLTEQLEQGQNAQATALQERLSTAHEHGTELQAEVETQRALVDLLQTEVTVEKARVAALEAELAQEQEQSSRLTDVLQAATDGQAASEATASEAREALNERMAMVEALQAKVTTAESALKAAEANFEQQLASMQAVSANSTALTAQLVEIQEQLVAADASKADLLAQLTASELAKEAIQVDNVSVQAAQQQLTTLRQEHAIEAEDLHERLEAAHMRCAELEAEAVTLKGTVVELEEQHGQASTHLAKAEAASVAVGELQAQLAAANQTLNDHVLQRMELEASVADAGSAKAEMEAELSRKLEELNTLRASMQAEVTTLTARASKWNKKYDTLRERVAGGDEYLEHQVATLTERLEVQAQELEAMEELEGRYQRLGAERAKLEDRVQALTEENVALNASSARQAEIDALKGQVETLKQYAATQQDKLAQLQDKTKAQQAELRQLRQEQEEAVLASSGSRGEVALNELRKQNQALKAQLEGQLHMARAAPSQAAATNPSAAKMDQDDDTVQVNASFIARAKAGSKGLHVHLPEPPLAAVEEEQPSRTSPQPEVTVLGPSTPPKPDSLKRRALVESNTLGSPSRGPLRKRNSGPLSLASVAPTPSGRIYSSALIQAEELRNREEQERQVRAQRSVRFASVLEERPAETPTAESSVVAGRAERGSADPIQRGKVLAAQKTRDAAMQAASVDAGETPDNCSPQ